eukprot:1144153-Pelagomonas_calceolata.AAC.3
MAYNNCSRSAISARYPSAQAIIPRDPTTIEPLPEGRCPSNAQQAHGSSGVSKGPTFSTQQRSQQSQPTESRTGSLKRVPS